MTIQLVVPKASALRNDMPRTDLPKKITPKIMWNRFLHDGFLTLSCNQHTPKNKICAFSFVTTFRETHVCCFCRELFFSNRFALLPNYGEQQ